MGAFGTDSTSNSYDERQQTSGAASPNVRGANPIAFGDSSLSVGAKSNFALPGGSNLSNVTIGRGGSLTVTQSDPAVLQHIVDSVNEASNANADTIGAYLDKVTEAQSQGQDKTLAALAGLAQNQQTGGLDGVNKIVLYVVLSIVLGAVAVAYAFRRK